MTAALHWSAAYVGIPWRLGGRDRAGLDCYGLARLVLAERAGVDVDVSAAPAVADLSRPRAVAAVADQIASRAPWLAVTEPRELDVAVFASPRLGRHLGLVIAPERMLHADAPMGSHLARLDEPRWRRSLIGYVRHQAFAGASGGGSAAAEGNGAPVAVEPCASLQIVIAQGARIREMVAEVLPAATDDERRALVSVWLCGHEISPSAWAARPHVGMVVDIRVRAAGSLRTILQAVVTIGAMLVAPYLGAVIAGAFGITSQIGLGITNALVSAGLMFAGGLLLNALVPPPSTDDTSRSSPTYAISGWRNVENPDGPIPSPLGRHRQAPVVAASIHTEVSGVDDQFVRGLFVFGDGPLLIENIRIGETPIDDFKKVDYEVRQGTAADAPITLYTQQVVEEQLSIYLVREGEEEEHIRRTQSDVTAFSVDFACPGGLGYQNDKGKIDPWSVGVRIRWRQYGETEWLETRTCVLTGHNNVVVRGSWHYDVPVRGRYEVSVTRVTISTDNARWLDDCVWVALRSHRPEPPLVEPYPLAKIAVRIKATKQLNGTLDELTADVTRICPDWDADTQTWITRPTRNPASLYRWVAQSPAARRPRTDAEIDLEGLQVWHAFCVLHALSYDRIHDYEASQDDVLAAIAAAGRASRRDDGRKLGVIIDQAQTLVQGTLTPRNATNIEWEQDYVDPPDAVRATFKDETDDYSEKELVVPWPGFDGTPDRTEDWTQYVPGITDPVQLWRALRRRQLELIHRPARYRGTQAIAQLHLARGDLALISYDVLDAVQTTARVKEVAGSMIRLDTVVAMEEGRAYGLRAVSIDGSAPASTVVTQPGESDILTIATGPTPAAGAMVMFGRAGQETLEGVVSRIERAGHGEATVTLVDHAPQIDGILAATDVPEWDGRVGTAAPADTTPPPAPTVSVLSSQAAGGMSEDGTPRILVTMTPAGTVLLASYTVQHRLSGTATWTAESVSAGTRTLITGGYAIGAMIEVRAQARSQADVDGDWSAIISHEIAADDVDEAPGSASALAGELAAGVPELTWQAPASSTYAASRIWRTHSGGGFAAATDVSGPLYGPADGTQSFTDTAAGAGTWDYFVTAEASGGARSDPTGPVTLTVEEA